jgi:hypothetical protein
MAIIRCPRCGRECDLSTGLRHCANCAGELPDPGASFAAGKPTNGFTGTPESMAGQRSPATTLVRCPHCGRENDLEKGIEYCLECGRNLPSPGAVQPAESAPTEPGRGPEALGEATLEASRLLLVGGAVLLLFGAVSFGWITPDAPPPDPDQIQTPDAILQQKHWEMDQQQRSVDLLLASLAAVSGLAVAGLGLRTRTEPFQGSLAGVAVVGLTTAVELGLVLAGIDNLCVGSAKVLVLLYFFSLVFRACLRINEVGPPA